MADSRVAVFLLDDTPRQSPFLAWASLVGPQVALLHLPKGDQQVEDGTPCRCQIHVGGVADEVIDGTLRRTTVLRSAPPFAFLDTRADAAVTQVSDPRFWSPDLRKLGRAIWTFVADQAASDPDQRPRLQPAAGDDRESSEEESPTKADDDAYPPAGAGDSDIVVNLAAKPWWCKLFRSAPGC